MAQPKSGRPGELLPAVTRVIELVGELDKDVIKTSDPRWTALHGPRLQSIKHANTYLYRDVESVRPFTMMPKNDNFEYQAAFEAYLQLAATCLKIAIDYQAAEARERRLFRRLMKADIVPAVVGAGGDDEVYDCEETDE